MAPVSFPPPLPAPTEQARIEALKVRGWQTRVSRAQELAQREAAREEAARAAIKFASLQGGWVLTGF